MNPAANPQEPSLWLIFGIIIAFPIVFSAFWCAVCFLISRFGWSHLAKVYATDRKPQGGMVFTGQTGQFGVVGLGRYRHCLNLTLADEGVYLSVNVLFRCGHPPLLVPWENVETVREGRYGFIKCTLMALSHGRRKLAVILPLRNLQEIEAMWRSKIA